MSQLGDFLEVVYGPESKFSTVHAHIRQWSNPDLAKKADQAKSPVGLPKIGSRASRDEATAIVETEIETHIRLPDKYRLEKKGQVRGQVRESLVVVNGEQQWKRDAQGNVETGQAASGIDIDIGRHFDQASLREFFVGLSLQLLGEAEFAGRHCVRLRAIPRPGESLWPHWLPCGADEYEFGADPEYGVVLYIAGRSDGDVFEINEVTRVSFAESLDDSFFSYSASPEEQVRPAEPIVERISLSAAVARMSFTVLVPKWLPDADHTSCEVMYHRARANSPRPHLSMMYRNRYSLWIHEGGTPDPDVANLEWEQIEHQGEQMSLSDPGIETGKRVLVLEKQGTHVTIVSDLTREQLIEVAASLVAAS